MHDAYLLAVGLCAHPRPEGQIDLLGHRKGVHVGAERDDGAGPRSAKHAHDAVAADAGAHVDAETAEMPRDDASRADFPERQLGVLMDVPPPGDDLRLDGSRVTVDGGGKRLGGRGRRRRHERRDEQRECATGS